MAYVGAIYRVLLSAPSDLSSEDRQTISRVINDWNVRDAETRGAAAVLMDWAGHTAAEWGIRPQGAINEQLVDLADVVLAVFWTRLGSPTGEAESGTVEELTRAAKAGKYVAVLRCMRPARPNDIDTEQLNGLEAFFAEHRQDGLVKEYDDEVGLIREVEAVLLFAAGRASNEASAAVPPPSESSGPSVVADVHGVGSDGKFSLYLQNVGDLTAYDISFTMQVAPGLDGDLPMVHKPEAAIEELRSGQSMDFPGQSYGSVADLITVVTSFASEPGGEPAERRSTVRV